MKLLDLFCGGGGSAVGYHRAGFSDITGVDIVPQKRYPFRFIQDDAVEFMRRHGQEFDFIHASPPCQAYSKTSNMSTTRHNVYPDLVSELRDVLVTVGRSWIIENVVGAPLRYPIMLCGTQFRLRMFRHRYFESSMCLFAPDHRPHTDRVGRNGFVTMVGKGDSARGTIPPDHRNVESWRRAYTEFLGRQVLRTLTENSFDIPSCSVRVV